MEIIVVIVAILVLIIILQIPKVKTEKTTDLNLTNDVDQHLAKCQENAKIRDAKAKKELDDLIRRNELTRQKSKKIGGIIELNKSDGKSPEQRELELIEAVKKGWVYDK